MRSVVAMTVCEVVLELEVHHGSDRDPIIYEGEEITPRDLEGKTDPESPARDVHIAYYGGTTRGQRLRLVHGSLAGMLLDRRHS